MPQKVQTLGFKKDMSPSGINNGDGWTRAAAVAWAGDHNFRNDKVDETEQSFRLRQFDPDKCTGTPQTLTQNFPPGVSAVSCEVEEEDSLRRCGLERRGDNLASLLSRLIDEQTTDDRPREEIISAMADAAGISQGTVSQILSGSINCPPLNRLRGFARVLGISIGRLVSAAESDGCDYSVDEEDSIQARPEQRQKEIRHYPMQLRLKGDESSPSLEGHIAVFNKLSVDLGGFREKIAPGAFAETLKIHDIMALWNHNDDLVLGRTSAKTLELEEDDVGLAFRNKPPAETSWFKDRIVSLKRGDVTGCSFGFYTDADEWGQEAEGMRIRTLKKVTLVEVSPGVTFPAYPQADIAMRSFERWQVAEAERRNPAGQPGQNLVQMDLRTRRLHLQRLAL